MITEDYVGFETARLLKEKGFDAQCHMIYTADGKLLYANVKHHNMYVVTNKYLEYYTDIIAPTLQMAMKWLREVYNQIIIPGISLDDRTSSTINHYIVGIWYIPENNGGAFCYTSPTPYNGYPSFEEACEAGIRYCLENLF